MLLTIITINYNNAAGLRKTVESVANQTSKDFEYIVVDGASTDGSVEFIQTFKLSNFQTLNYISEPDSGIYNAMNKGIRMAKGDYIHFLNSGDWLVDEHVVEKMLDLTPNPSPKERGKEGVDILIGDVISIRPDGKRRYDKNPKSVSLYTFYRGTIQHTSAYIRRSLFEKYGFYDESLKIVSDWKWYLNVVILNGATVQFADLFVTCFDRTGISSTQLDLDQAERRKVLEELIPAPILVDYDRYHFDIDQMERIKKHRWLYRLFWFVERVYFKFDKWDAKYWGWKK
jgi:glycosyltransferase involved in cell wall biosynthesis